MGGDREGEKGPDICVVGSSNYTQRSYTLDLEVGCLVVTEDKGLKKRLGAERDGLLEYRLVGCLIFFPSLPAKDSIHKQFILFVSS